MPVRLITSYFKLRSLVVQRSKHLENCLQRMKALIFLIMQKEFDLLPGDAEPARDDGSDAAPASTVVQNPKGPRIMLQAAVDAITFCPEIVIRELSSIILPAPVVTSVPVLMQKARTQEDFIPGRLPREPVQSATIGTVFRDIKDKFCRDTGMEAFLQDDHGIELLVLGNIISLSLPIDEVYKRVWQPAKGPDTAMIVVGRMQGLDGEATEPFIQQFPRVTTDDVSPELKYEYTTVLCEGGRFREILSVLEIGDLSPRCLVDLVKLLSTFTLVKRNRDALNALPAVTHMFGLMKTLVDNASAELFSEVIAITAALIAESPESIDTPDDKITFIFEALQQPLVRSNESVLGPFLALIPPIASRAERLMRTVLRFFLDQIRPADSNASPMPNIFKSVKSLFMLNGFAAFVAGLPESSAEIRGLIFSEPILKDAVDYLQATFVLGAAEEWRRPLEDPCLPALLKIVAGMARCHRPTQELLLADDAYLIRLLLELEGIPTAAAVGDCATLVLQNALADPSVCAAKLCEIRQTKLDSARLRAEHAREQALAQAAQPLPQSYAALMAEIHDEPWECCICKEGYEARPDEILGIYVFVNRLERGVNTATFFVCVHPSCHADAVPSERRGERQVGEWAAAAVRNSERPCNAIFPLPSATLPAAKYRAALTRYLDEARARAALDNFTLVVGDVRHTLASTAAGERIPLSAGGGSLSAIFSLIPFLVYAGHAALADGEARRAAEVRLETLLQPGGMAEEAAVCALWLLSREEWDAVRTAVLTRLVKQRARAPVDDAWQQPHIREAFFLFILVDRIARMVKEETGKPAAFGENGALKVGPHKGAPWIDAWMETVARDGRNVALGFEELAADAEDEIFKIGNLRDALIFAEIGAAEPTEWLAAALA
jgi:E3 ubiquitin-protein ligase UBR4